MNSLEFIKMHVDEWPSTDRHQLTHCILLSYGILAYGAPMGVGRINPYEHIDLSEHFAPDYYDGKMWTREDFESFGDGDDSSIEWEDASVCYADGDQWFESGHESLVNESGDSYEYESIIDLKFKDFKLNELHQGDCIAVDEIDDEDEYHDVVDVFMLFGFPRWEDACFEDTLKSKWLVVDKDSDLIGADYLISDCKRMVSYNQLITIGKLKKMLNDCHNETVCGKVKADFINKAIDRVNELVADEKPTLWSPTINSIVDVGDCEGVVKAIDGEHYWVLKDTGMYDTYHKDSLNQPLTEEEKLYKDAVAALSDAAWITNCESKTVVGKLDNLGYKIVRKETSE